MRVSKKILTLFTAAVMCAALIACVAVGGHKAMADSPAYEGAYRNRLSFSAAHGWNNDPNGLLYVDGVWHMYFQYNYDKATGKTENGWGHMSWGHAVSSDLVHWEEKAVALPEGTDGYGMMFSGSAVYDKYNTSGLFETEGGKVKPGQGIVAILTQPTDKQRQILAYSKDGGDSFEVYGEVIGAACDGGVGDNEFRDPKAFYSEKLGKWLLAVGGGSIRMYSSENLIEWDYLGETGYWGECPDISRHEVDGEEKYVLIMSPEDKENSHKYNGTTRADAYYPAEYYVVGDLDENGLFVSNGSVRRLSEGIDSYAFQSFNGAPGGKVYGISWSASWKTCGMYEPYRKYFNGGMTVTTELELVKENGGYKLLRKPVEGYEALRGEKLGGYSGTLEKGQQALSDIHADVADIEAELDFSAANANRAELRLRVSEAESILISYDALSETLTLDRSQSSLLAGGGAFYAVSYSEKVPLIAGKLDLRILLDRASVTMFANGGSASFFSAVFPSARSDGMKLTADGTLSAKVDVYEMNGIFASYDDSDFYLTTNKIDGTVGTGYPVVAYSFDENFDDSAVTFAKVEGDGNVKIAQDGGFARITPLSKGYAKIRATYKGESQDINVYIYNDGFTSNVQFNRTSGGFSFIKEDGMLFSDGGDGFRFSDTGAENFVYSAEFTPSNANAQAAGLVFGASNYFYSYWVASADAFEGKVKIWQPGVGEIKSADYPFERGRKFRLTAVVNEGVARIYVGDDKAAAVTLELGGYTGGNIGLNVFNGEFIVNNVAFLDTDTVKGDINLGGNEVLSVYNLTDGNKKLNGGDYSTSGGVLTISPAYIKTLEAGREYLFRAVTTLTEFDFEVTADFTPVTAYAAADEYYRDSDVVIGVGSAEVYSVTVDGKAVAFTVSGGRVVIDKAVAAELSTGKHTAKLFTSGGRPEAEFTIAEKVGTEVEPEPEPTHTFFYIDVGIFAALILAYVVFTVIKKAGH